MTSQLNSIEEVIDRWRGGEPPDARAALLAHPEIVGQKSAVLDLAYEEFCLRTEAGEKLAASTFCDKFPTCRHSLQRLLEVHQYLHVNSGAAALLGEPKWPALGERLLGFEIREELGRGAIGRVFLAQQPALGNRWVVLKLSVGGAAEAETLGRLAHPNVVPVFSVEEDPGTGLTAVCMPYLGTATLCDVLDRAALGQRRKLRARVVLDAAHDCRDRPASADLTFAADRLLAAGDYVDGVLHLGVQLARALAFTHSKGVLHRDLKPSNVLLAPSGKPMLLDFNLSFDQQLSGARVGATLPYAAPEQLRALFSDGPASRSTPSGDRSADSCPTQSEPLMDPRSDVFSLGVILYELLSGDLPFQAGGLSALAEFAEKKRAVSFPAEQTIAALLARQAAGPAALRQRNPLVDPAAAAVVERCLKFDPRDRPASAEELATNLAACLAPRRRIARWCRRNRWSLAAAAAFAAAVLAIGGLLLANRDPYPLREFRAGAQDYAIGDYSAALGHFDHALQADPRDPRLLFARGQTRQRLGDYVGAAADYKVAAELSPAGIICASLAYCDAAANSQKDAVTWGERAIDAGFTTAEVHNNLGYSLWWLGKLDSARRQLDEAIRLKPDLQAAYLNRVKVGLRQALRGGSPAAAIADAKMALRLGPATAELYLDAARLQALDGNDSHRDEIIRGYLVKAIEAGLAPQAIQAEPLFAPFLATLAANGSFRAQPAASPTRQPILLVPPSCPSIDRIPTGN